MLSVIIATCLGREKKFNAAFLKRPCEWGLSVDERCFCPLVCTVGASRSLIAAWSRARRRPPRPSRHQSSSCLLRRKASYTAVTNFEIACMLCLCGRCGSALVRRCKRINSVSTRCNNGVCMKKTFRWGWAECKYKLSLAVSVSLNSDVNCLKEIQALSGVVKVVRENYVAHHFVLNFNVGTFCIKNVYSISGCLVISDWIHRLFSDKKSSLPEHLLRQLFVYILCVFDSCFTVITKHYHPHYTTVL